METSRRDRNRTETKKDKKQKHNKKQQKNVTVVATIPEEDTSLSTDGTAILAPPKARKERTKSPVFLVVALILAVALLIISGLYCFTLLNRIDDLNEQLEAKRINEQLAQERAYDVANLTDIASYEDKAVPEAAQEVEMIGPELAAEKVPVVSYVSYTSEKKPKPVETPKKSTSSNSNKSSSSSSSSSSGNVTGSTNGKVLMVSWSQMNSLWPRGATATLIDVRTGRSFQIKRQAGGQHADIEPLTAKDTAILKECYGGKWSWDRRPVLFVYGGKYYAASMNGMPHGADTLPNNGMSGQTCLHFLGSTTHNNRTKTDPLHQACVKEAFNNGNKVIK
ncbi:hypothetical protein LJC20_02670 [Eubacteriales bacterium OttesenSCG-928-M02]|nr:hypothetical protein [Eubacteriales bacterium OttesenSCG-928-M02]